MMLKEKTYFIPLICTFEMKLGTLHELLSKIHPLRILKYNIYGFEQTYFFLYRALFRTSCKK